MTPHFASPAAMVAAMNPDRPVHCLRPAVLTATARDFVGRFPGDVLYAVKCNDDPRVLQALHEGGVAAFDTASLPEVAAVSRLLPSAACHFMHPVKSRAAIRAAYHRHGVRSFALDHEDELAKIREETGGAAELTLVVRLEAPVSRAVFDLGGKFGASPAAAAALLRRARDGAARLGLTWHVGSQCLDPAAYGRAIAQAGAVAARAGVPIDILDVGGGFPVPYAGSTPPALDAYLSAITAAKAAAGFDDRVRLWCEPGRALVAAGGSVVVRVELRRGDALYLNDGLYGSLSDMRIPGMAFPMRVLRAGGSPSTRRAAFRLFGPTCDSSDAMPRRHRLPADIREGDWIEIGQMGAYSATLRSGFNGFGAVETVLVDDPAFLPGPALRGPAPVGLAA